MKQSLQAWSVTENRISLGTVIDHGGPIQFGFIALDWHDEQVRALVDQAAAELARIRKREHENQAEVITMPLF